MGSKVIKYVVFAVIVVNLVIIAYVFLGQSTPPRPMPNPNGYDDFVKAGRMIRGNVHDYSVMNREELAALVATNAQALKLLRVGLSYESRVPDDYGKGYLARLSGELGPLKGLSILLAAEGKLAEFDGRMSDAVQIYLEDAHYGQECSRGGVLISRLVGNACEGVALNQMKDLTNKVDAPTARQVATTLQSIDEKSETMAATMLQEQKWNRAENGIFGQVKSLFESKAEREFEKAEISQVGGIPRLREELILDFAARAYELEKGKPPQSAADLVPDYLKAVPKDPVTGKDLGLGR